MTPPTWSEIQAWLDAAPWWSIVRALLILLGGLIAARLLAAAAVRAFAQRLDAHRVMIMRRAVMYVAIGLTVATALNQLGFNLGVLLGAAGVASIAIGFAAQTAFSNLISGLFLVGERPFGVGDLVRIGATTGVVLSIDLLSVKLRTPDNLLVRIPNETLLKSEITNLSRFPIRRIDLPLRIAYKEDIARVRALLFELADANPMCLEEPKPLFMITGFGASAVDLQFSVWGRRENFLDLKNAMLEAIKNRFDAEGIEIPFPHVSLDPGRAGQPLAVRLTGAPADRSAD